MKYSKFIIFFLLISKSLFASDDIEQWRGPDRNGHYPEKNLMKSWPVNGPELLWSFEGIGDGYSSATISNDIVYVSGKKDSIEFLTAINTNGEQLWQIPYGLACEQSFPETRGTPTIEGNRIYVISCRGQVVCIDKDRQEILWSLEALRAFGGEFAAWEIAESPLLVDDKVIYTPGGSETTIVALDKYTGELLWKSESLEDSTAYVSPILIEHKGRKIIANITRNYLVGVNSDNGEILWTYKYGDLDPPGFHPEAPFINCVTPVFQDGKLFITSGYDHTSVMFNLSEDGNEITLAWKQPVLDTHHGGVIYYEGYIYGSNWINNSKGNWVCLDWNTGDVMYEKEWETKGAIIEADDMFYLYDERRGTVALAQPGPQDLKIVSTFRNKFGTGPHWAHPSIKNGVLYLRHGKELAAYKIAE